MHSTGPAPGRALLPEDVHQRPHRARGHKRGDGPDALLPLHALRDVVGGDVAGRGGGGSRFIKGGCSGNGV